MILYYGDSQKGLVRKANEDAINLSVDNLFILADGMGGYEGGQIASTLSVETVGDFLKNLDTAAAPEDLLKQAFLAANESVLLKKLDNPALKSMGTTLLASLIKDNCLFWAHVGDSRLYQYTDGVMTQITTDHSFVMELVKEGKLTKEQMRVHPRKNEITRAVGIERKLKIDTGHFTLSDGTMVLMCSDGVSGMLDDSQLEEMVRSNPRKDRNQLEILGKEIMNQVYLAGARDNASLILVQYWNTVE
jgi:protein phosphatase